ncbi:2OG-Fe(II) oxygenase [Fimbriiglobus ruber]|uniref:Prolyl 4-hydroxylase alpha subunit Fe(2+) 2OG dioxygenase domain-containing protein n=1 Tax=Fimbriiglobus ruber TaxID=1908690 RepID=A0A225D9P0_9BACT|nr:2OG-Fe(II) oxygenase [Fimbriiglobus ruber]OWK38182.1 hypothetical protein FRUB_07302 [Fimbriiglobus ruber]
MRPKGEVIVPVALVDTKVRNAFELSPTQFTLTEPKWDETIAGVLRTVAGSLGLPADRLEAHLYKLLVYRKGGFFLPHRDSEKHDRMVASLIVALPSTFRGGSLIVRHHGASQKMDFQEAATGRGACFAAFYADCEHEVERVTDGFRLCLAYNLVLRVAKSDKKTAAPAPTTPVQELARSISAWVAAEKAEPLVFALDHHYTQHGLSPDLLKGDDRAAADLILPAAEEAGCLAYLCQVSRHTNQYADDGQWGRRRGYSDSVPRNLSVGEIYEDTLQGEEWVDAEGQKQAFPTINFDTRAIVASTPLDQWKPTREAYEGFTGNAGNTLDRWYHRSAVCVWHRDHHFDVIARGGHTFAVDLLQSMAGRLAKTPKKRLKEARRDCVRLARATINHWPKRYRHRHHSSKSGPDPTATFPKLLLAIDDLDTTQTFLKLVRDRDPNQELGALIVATCRKHGCAAVADELTAFFEPPRHEGQGKNFFPPQDELNSRDFVWLDRLAVTRFDDPTREAVVAKLARQAATRFQLPLEDRRYYHEDPTHADLTLAPLLRSLLVARDDQALQQVIAFVTGNPKRFPLEKVQVPSLDKVVPWYREENAAIHPQLETWLGSLRQELSAATAHEPEPPDSWARPAEVACTCAYCRQLNAFLADPHAPTGRIAAAESTRSHLLSGIQKHQSDVTSKLEKKGSPYALVFTKTNGSFERRMERYVADLKLLDTVNALLNPGEVRPAEGEPADGEPADGERPKKGKSGKATRPRRS